MSIEIEYIESEDTLYVDVRAPGVKLVELSRSCPF